MSANSALKEVVYRAGSCRFGAAGPTSMAMDGEKSLRKDLPKR